MEITKTSLPELLTAPKTINDEVQLIKDTSNLNARLTENESNTTIDNESNAIACYASSETNNHSQTTNKSVNIHKFTCFRRKRSGYVLTSCHYRLGATVDNDVRYLILIFAANEQTMR